MARALTLSVFALIALVSFGCGNGNRQSSAPPAAVEAPAALPDIASADPRVQYFHQQLVEHGEDLESAFGGDLLTLGMNPRDLQQDDPKHAYDTVLEKVKAVDDVSIRREMMRTFFNLADAP